MVKLHNANQLSLLILACLLPSCQAADTGNDATVPATVPATAESPAPAPDETAATPSTPAMPRPASDIPPCQLQDGKRLPETRLRAVGTEPFWGARIEGRCVTYSTPDNPDGTRIWTRLTGSASQRIWTGALDGQRFVLELQKAIGASCSDGMSDRRYPFDAKLQLGNARERGCAEPN